jgi:hypothetical protein
MMQGMPECTMPTRQQHHPGSHLKKRSQHKLHTDLAGGNNIFRVSVHVSFVQGMEQGEWTKTLT